MVGQVYWIYKHILSRYTKKYGMKSNTMDFFKRGNELDLDNRPT